MLRRDQARCCSGSGVNTVRHRLSRNHHVSRIFLSIIGNRHGRGIDPPETFTVTLAGGIVPPRVFGWRSCSNRGVTNCTRTKRCSALSCSNENVSPPVGGIHHPDSWAPSNVRPATLQVRRSGCRFPRKPKALRLADRLPPPPRPGSWRGEPDWRCSMHHAGRYRAPFPDTRIQLADGRKAYHVRCGARPPPADILCRLAVGVFHQQNLGDG